MDQKVLTQMLLNQGMQSEPVYHPLQGLGKIAQSYVGQKKMKEEEARKKAEMDRITGALGNREALVSELLGSSDPRFQQVALSQALAGQKQQPGFTLGAGQMRFDANGKMIAQGAPAKTATEPTFAEKEKIKGDQKRVNALSESAASRQASLQKAQKFLDLFESGKMESGAGRKFASLIPGAWTEQGQRDEEFNAFAETAARQALKASGEIRPTDADVKGMKEAMFGIGRDENVNIQLLKDYISQQKKDEDSYQSLVGGKASGGIKFLGFE